MDVAQLQAFQAVADELHFGRAAERLHLAQPYLSRTIRALERDLGAPLFDRTTRRVELTAAGHALVEPARAMLALCEEARAEVGAAHRGESGRVRFGFAGPSSHSMVGMLARAVRAQHPRVNLVLRPGRYGTAVVRELLDTTIDLGLARFDRPPVGVAHRVIGEERYAVCIPSTHRLADRARVSVAELRDEPIVAFPETHGSTVRSTLVELAQRAGFAPRFAQSAPDSWTCVALVAAGVGLHLSTNTAVQNMRLDGLHVAELADDVAPILVYLLWRADDDTPALARVLATAEELLPTPPPRSLGQCPPGAGTRTDRPGPS